MAEAGPLKLYSIPVHRGFADALVAGLVPRYAEPELGLARLTLLLPSARAARTITEAFVRHAGEHGMAGAAGGMLLPRMVLVGDLDLDEKLGPLLDPLETGASVPAAVEPSRRWLRLAQLIREEQGDQALRGSALLRLAYETGRTIDRLLAQEIAPLDLLSQPVIDEVERVADHWRANLHLFARVYTRWKSELEQRGEVDAAERRNLLFRAAAQGLRAAPPATALVAAGVTSAAPALAALLRAIAQCPRGAVVLPDLDLSLDDEVWEELGLAGDPSAPMPFGREDAFAHPQYHLKLLLNRMGVARGEVRPWHRAGAGQAPPARSQAVSNLFLPPRASLRWASLPAAAQRLPGLSLIEAAHPEEEAQAIALLVREAVEEPGRRVAVVTPDRALAARIVQHLARWNIAADDSAGRPLSQTPAGRVLLALAEVVATGLAPVALMALLLHPLVAAGEGRGQWLAHARALERRLRGPRPQPGLAALAKLAHQAGAGAWWQGLEPRIAPLLVEAEAERGLADWLDLLVQAGEALCGEPMWAREDGRALAAFVEDLGRHARACPVSLIAAELPHALREAMDRIAVRPAHGGHDRVAIYGLLEARMTRADLVICAGMNEGVWPPAVPPDPLLPPGVLRLLGVPGAEFRIGLAAHDLAGALGAPRVVLTRSRRDADGPAVASRFLLRLRAMLGKDQIERIRDEGVLRLARALDPAPLQPPPYPRPAPVPAAHQRPRKVSVTALDRLHSDPYQFYAQAILRLRPLELLDADPGPAWKGVLVHAILECWHQQGGDLAAIAGQQLAAMASHPVAVALWRPRLLAGLQWVSKRLAAEPQRRPLAWECEGALQIGPVRIEGKADRIDRLPGGGLAIVDYKTGAAPHWKQVEAGYAMQLGTLGLIAQAGGFAGVDGQPERFEYWSLGRSQGGRAEFGKVCSPVQGDEQREGIPADRFLHLARQHLETAVNRWLLGEAPFTARPNPDAVVYESYDQLMRLAEWYGREGGRA